MMRFTSRYKFLTISFIYYNILFVPDDGSESRSSHCILSFEKLERNYWWVTKKVTLNYFKFP